MTHNFWGVDKSGGSPANYSKKIGEKTGELFNLPFSSHYSKINGELPAIIGE